MTVPKSVKRHNTKDWSWEPRKWVNNFTAGFEFWARSTGCAINNWIRACPKEICFQVLVYSFHSLYLIAATGVWKRKWEFKRAKATSSFCLTLGSTVSVITSPLACAVGPPIPAVLTLGRFALGQVFGSVLLERPSLDVSLARDPWTILREYWVVCWHLLQVQWTV